MQPNDQIEKDIVKKRIFLIITSSCIIVLISIATIFVLKTLNPVAKNNKSTAKVYLTKDIASSYSKTGTINGLSSDTYRQYISAKLLIIYKNDEHSYSVYVPADDNVTSIQIKESQPTDKKSIQEQTTAFMSQKGLKLDKTNTVDKYNVSYVTYINEKITCQLTSYEPDVAHKSPRTHQLACVEISKINSEYSSTDKLLNIYKLSSKIPTFTASSRLTKTEGDKSYAILSLRSSGVGYRLLFAAVNNNWDYICNLSSSNNNISPSSKYNLTTEIKAKINDPKYGDFLSKNIK